MLSYFSQSPTSSSPENKKARTQVLEVDKEDNSPEDKTIEDPFQDISTLRGNEVSQKGDGSIQDNTR